MKNKMIINAISAVLAMGLTGSASSALAASETAASTTSPQEMGAAIQGMEKCYGIAKAGMNDCSAKSHNCSGEAKIDNDKQEWLYVPTGLCQRIAGGNLKLKLAEKK